MDDKPADAVEIPESPDATDALKQLRDLFDTLVPPDRLDIQDALGNTYSVRGVLPARAQIMVLQHLQRLWDNEVSGAAFSGDTASIVGAIASLAADDGILNGISEAFAVAHPAAVKSAVKAASAEGLTLEHPADLFPVEELVSGLVPFFVRFAAKTSNLVSLVTSK